MLNQHYFIAIDSGKSYTKYAFRNEENMIEKGRFPTKVAEVNSSFSDLTGKNEMILYNGKHYLVGEMLSDENSNYDLTKQTIDHLLCIYLAIVKVLDKSDSIPALANIHLAVNTPLLLYKNEKLKKEFENFIKQDGNVIGIEINNKPFSFKISTVSILPECIGPLYYNTSSFRDKRLLIMDFGSLNVSFLEMNNLIPQYDRMVTATAGVNILRAKLTEMLTSKHGIALFDDDVEQILKTKTVNLFGEKQEESTKLVKTLIQEHIRQIMNYAKSRKISINSIDNIILVGGGSILLKSELLEQLPSALVYPDAHFSNVLSFLRILEAKQHERRTKT
ncbi:ParM/StbA family protein [Alkalihalobacterium bogoriense]|uniref:ParM/StbA family protein n=1 Tax=Alkalihalobacterium bogoriense TaxID=246272 RepID=UPI00047B0B5C|nr:ParM/StbA family protein [Alkalihalobacterium bogoriense]